MISGLSLKKTPHLWLPHAKTTFYLDLESHVMILWHVMSVKLNIGKKIAGLEMITLNREKKIACFETYITDV